LAKKSESSKATKALDECRAAIDASDWFAADRAGVSALSIGASETVRDFQVVSDACQLLAHARSSKLSAAIETGKLIQPGVFDAEADPIEPACYLIEPPMVGADGRVLRERAEAEGIPVLVVVREPTTRLGKWPVVMIGPATVRVRIDPPPNDEPTIDWLIGACDALGLEAVRQGLSDERPEVRLSLLLERLQTLNHHAELTQEIVRTCETLLSEPVAKK
jgi:hypothetical protein